MEPTLLHTLNADVQGLLSEKLIENTLATVGRHSVCLVQHRMNDRNDIPTINPSGHHQKQRDSFYICLGSDPKLSLLKLISHLVEVCDGKSVGFIQVFHSIFRVGSLFKRRPLLTAEMDRLTREIAFIVSDTGLAIHGYEPYLFICMLFGRSTSSYVRATNQSLFESTVTNAHAILHPLLEVEDLMAMLNLSSTRDSITVQPLTSNLPVVHL